MGTKASAPIGALVLTLVVTLAGSARAQDAPEAVEVRRLESVARLRFGLSGHGGGLFGDAPHSGVAGVSLRLGVQITDWFALYASPIATLGYATDRFDDLVGVATWWNAILAEVSLGDHVQLAAGPSLDLLWGCDSLGERQTAHCRDGRAYAGFHGRAAFLFPAFRLEGPRDGVSFSVDVHTTWLERDGLGVAVVGGIGYELY